MGLALIGAGISAIGSIFGGGKRKKAAKAEAARVEAVNRQITADNATRTAQIDAKIASDESRLFAAANDGINQLAADQASAIALRAADESRLKDATGIDMVKLVADSQAAGFNPLTVLNATGGAGYDGRGAVLTTPFIGKADGFFRKADLMANSFAGSTSAKMSMAGMASDIAQYGAGLRASAGQAVAQSAGYIGDAVAGFGQALYGIGQQRTQMRHEVSMQNAAFKDAAQARSAVYGGGTPSGTRGRVPPLVAPTVATGPMNVAGAGAIPVKVMTATGPAYLRRDAADAFGVVDGQWIGGDLYAQILGDGAGEVRAVADVIFGDGPFVSAPRPQRRPSIANRPVNTWANPQPDFSGAM